MARKIRIMIDQKNTKITLQKTHTVKVYPEALKGSGHLMHTQFISFKCKVKFKVRYLSSSAYDVLFHN